MIKELIKLSNHLDAKGHRKEADYLDAVIRKMADETGTKDNPNVEVVNVTFRNIPLLLQNDLMGHLVNGAYNCDSERRALRNEIVQSGFLSEKNTAKHWPDENSEPSSGLKGILAEKGRWPESCNVQTDCTSIVGMMGQLNLSETEYPNPCTSRATYDKLQAKLKEIIEQE